MQLEVRYVKMNLATTFRRHVILQVLKLFTIREQNTKVWTVIYPHAKFEKSAPVTIEMFDKVKLTTSTKVSSLYLVTTGGVATLKAKKVVSKCCDQIICKHIYHFLLLHTDSGKKRLAFRRRHAQWWEGGGSK